MTKCRWVECKSECECTECKWTKYDCECASSVSGLNVSVSLLSVSGLSVSVIVLSVIVLGVVVLRVIVPGVSGLSVNVNVRVSLLLPWPGLYGMFA